MSDEIKGLAKRLREIVTAFPEDQSGLDRAADALEALLEERDRLTGGHVKSVPGEVSSLPLTPDHSPAVREIARKALEAKE